MKLFFKGMYVLRSHQATSSFTTSLTTTLTTSFTASITTHPGASFMSHPPDVNVCVYAAVKLVVKLVNVYAAAQR